MAASNLRLPNQSESAPENTFVIEAVRFGDAFDKTNRYH